MDLPNAIPCAAKKLFIKPTVTSPPELDQVAFGDMDSRSGLWSRPVFNVRMSVQNGGGLLNSSTPSLRSRDLAKFNHLYFYIADYRLGDLPILNDLPSLIP